MFDPRVYRYVYRLGISPKHKGFGYICDVVTALLESGAADAGLDEAICAACSKHGTGRRSAERCIRYAVQYAWDAEQSGLRRELGLGAVRGGQYERPPALREVIVMAVCELTETCDNNRVV